MDYTREIIYTLDLFGTAAFAFSGALRALDRRPDFIGMLILAGVTAVGGGAMRDMLLGRQAAVLGDLNYSLVIVATVLVMFLFPSSMLRRHDLFKYFDGIGLGVFSGIAAGLAVNWETPMNPFSVMILATLTGCCGGVLRDVMIQKPSLPLGDELYVTPVLIGAAGLMIAHKMQVGELGEFFTACILTTGIRFLGIMFDLRLPRIMHSEHGRI